MTDAKPTVASLVDAGLERREARWLLEEYDDLDTIDSAVARRLAGEPLQYVIGHWPFRELDLDLDERVLIPRPETEELVDVAKRELASSEYAVAPLVLDLGCGSGAIGLSLLTELHARGILASLVALDASSDALDVAKINARKHDLHAVSFVLSDWFSALDESLRGRFDLIVANPPYVSEDEFTALDPVVQHEPRRALVAANAHGVGGFADVATIIQGARDWLAPSGALVLEHGAAQGAAVLDSCERAGYDEYHDANDLAGRARMLVARR